MRKNRIGILHTVLGPIAALVINLLTAFVVYTLARLVYLAVNYNFFSVDLTFAHFCSLMAGGLVFDRTAIVYTNALYIVMMLFPLWIKENRTWQKACRWVFVTVNGLAFIINLADAVYFPYTMRRTTTSVFQEFDNENNLGGIVLTELWHHWYLVLVAVAVIYGMWKVYVSPRNLASFYVTRRDRLRHAAVMLVALIIAVPLAIGGARGGLGTGIRPITINNANQYVDRPVECALVLNTPFALIRTIGKSVFAVPAYYADTKSMERVFDPIHRPRPNAPFRRKNVVILIVESFGREYIGAFNRDLEGGRYRGFTPHVDRLISKSVVYRYSFCNGRKSIDGMPSVLCGIPMFVEPFVLTPASMNTYVSLAGLLDKEGYETSFFHGANRGSMGFMAFANKTGFRHYYGRQDYDADPRFGGDDDFDGHWGIWDEPFMQYWCARIGEMRQPFMTALFTVSSHHPFQIPPQYRDSFPEGKLPIHKCIRYTDMAIGRFFERASRQPWFKNTIFVLTSDHTNQTNHPEYETDLGGFSAPVIIYDPSGELRPGMRDAIAQQTDIMPTVLSYLHYGKPYLAFGCDLLTTPPADTYAINYLNGIYQYVKYGYVLQFDGQRTRAVYALTDRLMQHNLVGQVKVQPRMEQEVKAIVQQYMDRMVHDRLLPEGPSKTHQ